MPCLCYISDAAQILKKIPSNTAHKKYLSELQVLKFKCYFSDECTSTLTYDNFTDPRRDHYAACDYTSYQCKSCRAPVFKKDLVSHRYRCPDQPLVCKHCSIGSDGQPKNVKAADLAQHMRMMHGNAPMHEDPEGDSRLLEDNQRMRRKNPLSEFANAMARSSNTELDGGSTKRVQPKFQQNSS